MKRFVSDLFLPRRFYLLCSVGVLLFFCRFFIEGLGILPQVFCGALAVAFVADYFFLFVINRQPALERQLPERLSNGDENPIVYRLHNGYPFTVTATLIDELPQQFQLRSTQLTAELKSGEERELRQLLRPVERGAYQFGITHLYVQSRLGLAERRFSFGEESEIPVYPSFIQLRKYQLMAEAAALAETGNKRIRKMGHSMEFEQIREYVQGDDVRTINWKATARRGGLMVNAYTDEKSQPVYCVIDKGRLMKMPFNGLTLLDHAINASLVVGSVALHKQDRFGLLTFDHKGGSSIVADRKPVQLEKVLQVLYNQQTSFLESDFEQLYTRVRTVVRQRSLLVLFTNFESLQGLRRQLPYLKRLATFHLLLVVFFENTELRATADAMASDMEELYIKTIAGKFVHEKQLIVKELQQAGILCILTPPEQVTIQTINKYIEIKNRQLL